MSKVAGSALLKELTSARSAATVVVGGCHQLITPSPRFNRLVALCPNCRRLTVNRGLKRVAAPRSIKRSAAVDYPYQVGSQADSAGSIPVTRSKCEKRCSRT